MEDPFSEANLKLMATMADLEKAGAEATTAEEVEMLRLALEVAMADWRARPR